MAKKHSEFWDSLYNNQQQFCHWYFWLTEIAISRFKWYNLPETIDARFLELTLFGNGQALLFEDEVLGFLGLEVAASGPLDVYRIPTVRRAYSTTAYQAVRNPENSVLVYNNMLRQPGWRTIKMYAARLWDYDRTIDINTRAQKTPILITCDENEKLSAINTYQKWSGNEPVIIGKKGINNISFSTLNTAAPYVAPQVSDVKQNTLGEALSFLGVSNVRNEKRERLIENEVKKSMGLVQSSRYSALNSRQEACKKFNKMFGKDIWCEYREEIEEEINDNLTEMLSGEINPEVMI